ncbi:MAG TPA: tetratricopeptide repeat protein [Candidatus Binatia bacterium]|nr:tetratricopeptide repeat protein [Candidatus Binatia bacterium]
MPHGKSSADDYARLLLALRDAVPGDLIFVQLNSPVQRRQLPGKLAADGLQRPFAVADFATFQPGPPPADVLQEFLEEVKSAPQEILFVDGLEHWVEADPKTLDALNLGRERLANLGVVVVFLLPAYLIALIRARALNLWSWRAHHYSLEPSDTAAEGQAVIPSLNTGRTIAPGDTPEARDRRIRILRRLLNEGLAEHRTIESLTHSILLPLVWGLHDAGRFTEALEELDRLIDSFEKAQDSADKALLLNLRGTVLQDLGHSHEAELLLERALAIAKKVQGPEHPDVAAALNNLAVLYRSQGRYAQAESLYQQALAIAEKVRGPEDLDVATTLNNLAALYHSQGQYAQAESLYRRALTIWEKALGPEHPDVALSLNNLALLYDSQGQYAQAESLYRRVLAIREKVLGPEHPNVAMVLENYADLLRATNREAEAAKLEARARAIRAKHTRENPTK